MIVAMIRRRRTKAQIVHALMNASSDATAARVFKVSAASVQMTVWMVTVGFSVGIPGRSRVGRDSGRKGRATR